MDGNNQPIPQAPVPPQPKKSVYLIIAGLVIILILIPIAALIINQFNKKPTPVPPPQKTTMTGLEIAKKTATFLDKSIQSDGNIIFKYQCERDLQSKQGTCTSAINEKTDRNMWRIALAYWELFKRTREEHYKNSAEALIETVLNECQRWTHYCFVSMPAFYTFYKDTNQPRFKEAMLRGAEKIDRQIEKLSPEEDLLSSVYQGLGGFRLEYLYNVTGDEKYLKKLEELTGRIMDGELERHPQTREVVLENGVSVKPDSILAAAHFYPAAYKATKNPKYLQAAEEFFSKYDFKQGSQAWSKTYYLNADQKDFVGPNVGALLGLLELVTLSPLPQKTLFKESAFALAQEALLTMWDNPENQKFTGDYGFLTFADLQRNDNRKDLSDSSLRILQYLMLEEYTFQIGSKRQ